MVQLAVGASQRCDVDHEGVVVGGIQVNVRQAQLVGAVELGLRAGDLWGWAWGYD